MGQSPFHGSQIPKSRQSQSDSAAQSTAGTGARLRRHADHPRAPQASRARRLLVERRAAARESAEEEAARARHGASSLGIRVARRCASRQPRSPDRASSISASRRARRLAVIRRILEEGAGFGRAQEGRGEKVQVEFVSANPTGPLHVGHGRQAALGDAIAALLESQGYAVTREFYYNDAGAQIRSSRCRCRRARAASSPATPGWPEDGYAASTSRTSRATMFTRTDADDLDAIRAVRGRVPAQRAGPRPAGVRRQVRRYYLESSLYADGKVDADREALVARTARPTRRTARSGCAPPSTATTRTA